MLLQACATPAPQRDAEPKIAEALACFPNAWNRADMMAFGGCFTSDADFVNVTANWWKGRDSVQKNHAYLLGTIDSSDRAGVTLPIQAYGIFKGTTLTFQSTELRFLRADVVIARVGWQITDPRTPQPRHGRLMLVLTTSDAQWHIAAVQNTEIARSVK